MAKSVPFESALAASLAQILGNTGLQALGVTSPALAPAWTINPEASITAQTSELVLESSTWAAPVAGILTQRETLESDAIDANKVYLHLLPQLHDRLKELYAEAQIQDPVPRSFAYALTPGELVPEGIYRAGEALNLKGDLRVLGDGGSLTPTRVAANFVELLETHPILSATPRKPGTEIKFEAPQLKALSALVPGGQIGNVANLQTSSEADAMTMLDSVSFEDYDLSRWNFGPSERNAFSTIVDRLRVLVKDPSKVHQGVLNLCGPAAFLRLWFQRDPRAAARYTLNLLGRNNSVHLGNINVTPDGDFRNQDYLALEAKHARYPYPDPRSLPPAADWLAMGALRGSENFFLDFEGTAGETLAAMTYPRELAAWLRATAIYNEVIEDTNIWFTKPLEHALSLTVDPDHDAILLINMEMIQPPQGSIWDIVSRLVPNHYIVLNKIELLPTSSFNLKERVRIDYWSWGKNLTKELDVSRFQTTYYGAIKCALR